MDTPIRYTLTSRDPVPQPPSATDRVHDKLHTLLNVRELLEARLIEVDRQIQECQTLITQPGDLASRH